MKKDRRKLAVIVALLCGLITIRVSHAQENRVPLGDSALTLPTGVNDVVALFSGKSEEIAANWTQDKKPGHWKVEDGAIIASGSNLSTKGR